MTPKRIEYMNQFTKNAIRCSKEYQLIMDDLKQLGVIDKTPDSFNGPPDNGPKEIELTEPVKAFEKEFGQKLTFREAEIVGLLLKKMKNKKD